MYSLSAVALQLLKEVVRHISGWDLGERWKSNLCVCACVCVVAGVTHYFVGHHSASFH